MPFLWNGAQQYSFTTLKDTLTHVPILAFPDYKLSFTMCTDASALGIGAVLVQTEEGKHPHATEYASFVLTFAESKYIITHFETLVVAWALKHFRDIIFGYPVTVYMDLTTKTNGEHTPGGTLLHSPAASERVPMRLPFPYQTALSMIHQLAPPMSCVAVPSVSSTQGCPLQRQPYEQDQLRGGGPRAHIAGAGVHALCW